jgi:hypothetical protein
MLGVVAIACAAVAVTLVIVLSGSGNGLFPQGVSSSLVTFTPNGSNSAAISGTLGGLPLNATASKTSNYDEPFAGSAQGTLGSERFSGSLTDEGGEDTVTGTFNGKPVTATLRSLLSTTASRSPASGDGIGAIGGGLSVQGTIDGQPLSGTLRRTSYGEAQNEYDFSFSGTIGNLTITGSAGSTDQGRGMRSTEDVH